MKLLEPERSVAGIQLFKRGQHPSRNGIGRAGIAIPEAYKLRDAIAGILEKEVTEEDFRKLLEAVLMAKADSGNVRGEVSGVMNHTATYIDPITRARVECVIQEKLMPAVGYEAVRKKDVEAQLLAMTKLSDTDLIDALRNCDIWTFQVINAATTDLISDQLFEHGQFVDTDGKILRFPAGIQFFPDSIDPPYLPIGFDGVRQAVKRAIAGIQGNQTAGSDDFRDFIASMPMLKKGRGAKAKPYQITLASKCVELWKKYGQATQRKPSTTSRTGQGTKIVDFATIVFRKAGMPLSSRRLVALLKDARCLRAKELRDGRRFATKTKSWGKELG